MLHTNNPIILALDANDRLVAQGMFNETRNYIGMVKLGLEFVYNFGLEEVKNYILLKPVFLDLKLHDIPNTVSSALKPLAKLGVEMTTVHLLGGSKMVSESKKILTGEGGRTKLLGVTILTSHDDISEIGINNRVEAQVLKLVELGLKSGVDGLVCSPHEIKIIREEFGSEPILVVPGIRIGEAANQQPLAANSYQDDQSRTATPKQALQDGANYLVIGRPITKSHNPKEAAQKILNSLTSS